MALELLGIFTVHAKSFVLHPNGQTSFLTVNKMSCDTTNLEVELVVNHFSNFDTFTVKPLCFSDGGILFFKFLEQYQDYKTLGSCSGFISFESE